MNKMIVNGPNKLPIEIDAATRVGRNDAKIIYWAAVRALNTRKDVKLAANDLVLNSKFRNAVAKVYGDGYRNFTNVHLEVIAESIITKITSQEIVQPSNASKSDITLGAAGTAIASVIVGAAFYLDSKFQLSGSLVTATVTVAVTCFAILGGLGSAAIGWLGVKGLLAGRMHNKAIASQMESEMRQKLAA